LNFPAQQPHARHDTPHPLCSTASPHLVLKYLGTVDSRAEQAYLTKWRALQRSRRSEASRGNETMKDASALHADRPSRLWICRYNDLVDLYGAEHAPIMTRTSGARTSRGWALRNDRKQIGILPRCGSRVLLPARPSKSLIANHSDTLRDDLGVAAYRIFQVHRVGPCERLADSGFVHPAVVHARWAVGVRAGPARGLGGVAPRRADVPWPAARPAFASLGRDSRQSPPSCSPDHISKGNGN
jgi:hypothetical protein